MQSPIADRTFLLERAQEVLQLVRDKAVGEIEAVATLESVDEPLPAAAIEGHLAQALEDEYQAGFVETGAALESLTQEPQRKPYLPTNRVLALLQSAYDEYHEDLAESAALERPFDKLDPGWLTVAVEKLKALVRGKRPFISHQKTTDFQFDLPEHAVVALYSDWGTGEATAQRVMEQIQLAAPTHAIHLGDVYYSGTPKESEKRFLRVLEKLGPPAGSCRHFALNSRCVSSTLRHPAWEFSDFLLLSFHRVASAC